MATILNGKRYIIGDNIDLYGSDALTLYSPATVHDDLPPTPVIIAKLGASAPSIATFVDDIKAYTFDIGNIAYGATELEHKYKEGADIEAHIHWATNGTDVADKAVKWQLSYVIANCDAVAPFTSIYPTSQTQISKEVTIPASTGDRAGIVTQIGTISASSITIGAYIVWEIERIAASGDAPTSDPFGLAVGFHVEMNTIGSRDRYSK